jgi:hypothetical protein
LQIFSLRRSEVEIALPMMFKFLALGLIALAQVLVAQALASPNYFCTWAASSSLASAWSAAAINAAGDLGIAAMEGGEIYSTTDGNIYNSL